MRDSVFSPILLHASVTCALDRSLHDTMAIMRIGSTEADLGRVMNYVAKGLEAAIDRSGWKFLDELSPRQV